MCGGGGGRVNTLESFRLLRVLPSSHQLPTPSEVWPPYPPEKGDTSECKPGVPKCQSIERQSQRCFLFPPCFPRSRRINPKGSKECSCSLAFTRCIRQWMSHDQLLFCQIPSVNKPELWTTSIYFPRVKRPALPLSTGRLWVPPTM